MPPTCRLFTTASKNGAGSIRWSSRATVVAYRYASMRTALGIGFVAFTLLVGLIVWTRARIEIASEPFAFHAEQAVVDLELLPGDLT